MTFTAAYATFLHQLTGQADVIIGTPIANRTRQELEPLVGFFLNSLALRIDLSGHPTFRELLVRTRRVAIDAYANQDLPFERLVEELNPDRALGHTPLVQTFLVVDGAHAVGQVIAVGDVIMSSFTTCQARTTPSSRSRACAISPRHFQNSYAIRWRVEAGGQGLGARGRKPEAGGWRSGARG